MVLTALTILIIICAQLRVMDPGFFKKESGGVNVFPLQIQGRNMVGRKFNTSKQRNFSPNGREECAGHPTKYANG